MNHLTNLLIDVCVFLDPFLTLTTHPEGHDSPPPCFNEASGRRGFLSFCLRQLKIYSPDSAAVKYPDWLK